VVENVYRLMDEEGLTRIEAAKKKGLVKLLFLLLSQLQQQLLLLFP